jgi:hypothetical protein
MIALAMTFIKEKHDDLLLKATFYQKTKEDNIQSRTELCTHRQPTHKESPSDNNAAKKVFMLRKFKLWTLRFWCPPGNREDIADPLPSTMREEMELSLRSPAGQVAAVVS